MSTLAWPGRDVLSSPSVVVALVDVSLALRARFPAEASAPSDELRSLA